MSPPRQNELGMWGKSSYDIVEDNCLESKVLIMIQGKHISNRSKPRLRWQDRSFLTQSVLRCSRPGPQRCVKLTLGKTDETFTFTSYVHTHKAL